MIQKKSTLAVMLTNFITIPKTHLHNQTLACIQSSKMRSLMMMAALTVKKLKRASKKLKSNKLNKIVQRLEN